MSYKEDILSIIEYNSERLEELKLDINFDNINRLNKIIGRCRSLKTLHLELNTVTLSKYFNDVYVFNSFINNIEILKELKDFRFNILLFLLNEIVEKFLVKKIYSISKYSFLFINRPQLSIINLI